jgi:Ala-tRNA(Pro) deacylase
MSDENNKIKIDASLRFQSSLPVSSDGLLLQLDEWGIEYELFSHKPLMTVTQSKEVQNTFLSSAEGAAHIKNLYLRDHKKRNILLVLEQDHEIDLKKVKETLGTGRLSFGSAERLFENLGVRPGAVTPLSMITGVNTGVTLFMDLNLKSCKKIFAHPLVNDRTLGMSIKNLEKFFEKIKVIPNWVNLGSS